MTPDRQFTVICAHDQREAVRIRRRYGLPSNSGRVVVACNIDQLHRDLRGAESARVIETSGFHDRADALRIRRDLFLSGIDFGDWPKPGVTLVDQVGGNGLRGLDAIAAAAAPAGTRPAAHTVQVATRGIWSDPPVWQTLRREQALIAGQPHMLLLLDAEDLLDHELIGWPAHAIARPGGWRVLYTVTLRAIPGAVPYVVLRPSPLLPDGWLPASLDGAWQVRPNDAKPVTVARAGHALKFPAECGRAWPTGRLEARKPVLIEGGEADGWELAEVWEVEA
ncbi:hypothetical protein [Nonomuraea sp. NPDC003214]